MQVLLPSGWTFDSDEVQCAYFQSLPLDDGSGKTHLSFTIVFKETGNMCKVWDFHESDIIAYYKQVVPLSLLRATALIPGHHPIFDAFVSDGQQTNEPVDPILAMTDEDKEQIVKELLRTRNKASITPEDIRNAWRNRREEVKQ